LAFRLGLENFRVSSFATFPFSLSVRVEVEVIEHLHPSSGVRNRNKIISILLDIRTKGEKCKEPVRPSVVQKVLTQFNLTQSPFFLSYIERKVSFGREIIDFTPRIKKVLDLSCVGGSRGRI